MKKSAKLKSDKAIAEFMGYENVRIDNDEVYCYVPAPTGWTKLFPRGVIRILNYLDWKELMPVIKKIEDLGGKIIITTDINSTYFIVSEHVSFISTYNKTKITTRVKNACPECGSDVHDGTGTGWEVCTNAKCGWMC